MDFMRPQRDEILHMASQGSKDSFREDAQTVLQSDDLRDRAIFTGEARQPFIVATDAASTARLPNLVPDAWLPHFTELVFRAVDKAWGSEDDA